MSSHFDNIEVKFEHAGHWVTFKVISTNCYISWWTLFLWLAGGGTLTESHPCCYPYCYWSCCWCCCCYCFWWVTMESCWEKVLGTQSGMTKQQWADNSPTALGGNSPREENTRPTNTTFPAVTATRHPCCSSPATPFVPFIPFRYSFCVWHPTRYWLFHITGSHVSKNDGWLMTSVPQKLTNDPRLLNLTTILPVNPWCVYLNDILN